MKDRETRAETQRYRETGTETEKQTMERDSHWPNEAMSLAISTPFISLVTDFTVARTK